MAKIGRVLCIAVVVCVTLAPSATASGEVTDPCGLGSAALDAKGEPEPVSSWLDICAMDVSGTGTGPMRAVQSVLRLDGAVFPGARTGVSYDARFQTEYCTVWQSYALFAASDETQNRLWVHCDYRSEPCPWPVSEVEFVSCGSATNFTLSDTSALSASVAGNAITITFDPNRLPPGHVPAGLAHDLESHADDEAEADLPPPTLTQVGAQTETEYGKKGVASGTIGPGGDFAWGEHPVELE